MPGQREVWIGLHGPPIGSFRFHRAVLNPQEIAEIEPGRRIVRIEVLDTPVEALSRQEVAGLLNGLRLHKNFVGVEMISLFDRQHKLPF